MKKHLLALAALTLAAGGVMAQSVDALAKIKDAEGFA